MLSTSISFVQIYVNSCLQFSEKIIDIILTLPEETPTLSETKITLFTSNWLKQWQKYCFL